MSMAPWYDPLILGLTCLIVAVPVFTSSYTQNQGPKNAPKKAKTQCSASILPSLDYKAPNPKP